jgi:deoxyribodipyrimidine photo-lyase
MPYVACWLRRDLRLDDHAALFHALGSGREVLPVFIFDREILDSLPRKDARVEFLHRRLGELQARLAQMGSSLVVRYGRPAEVWRALAEEYGLEAVYANRDYEPYAEARDAEIAALLAARGAAFHSFRDQVLFERRDILSGSGSPYTVFTPYSRRWLAALEAEPERLRPFETEPRFGQFARMPPLPLPSLAEMGFGETGMAFPAPSADPDIIRVYDQKRNFPAEKGTTRIGLHLRFGTLSLRRLAAEARALNATYLNELIWREFYMQILANFPHVVAGPFRAEYARIPWREAPEDFQKWKEGRTGYPLVDAGMRELNATGYMHNRVRMVVASFLSKHLLINWQQGEAYFAEKLLDFELSSNSGGWQWAAGCGTDAAPYFRIFNPDAQMKKFDPEGRYVRRWIPEYGTPLYPRPVVEHSFARARCLEVYQAALKGA